jgi:hypothetical protein
MLVVVRQTQTHKYMFEVSVLEVVGLDLGYANAY